MEKRGRVITSTAEAQEILESTSTRKTLVSWFAPFYSQMQDAIEKGKHHTILGGTDFKIRLSDNKQDCIFTPVVGFVPMSRIPLDKLNDLATVQNAAASN